MTDIRRYEVQGTAAIAYRDGRGESPNIIDYDIARRSHEARVRLAERQAAAGRAISADTARSLRRAQGRMDLQDAVRENFTPNRSMGETLGNLARQAGDAIASHPMAEQLRHGSLKGRETGKATYRQVFTSASACLAVSMLMLFVGA